MSDVNEFIKTLSENDVGFYCSHPDHSGQRTIFLSAEQLMKYIADPPAYLAQHYGVTRQQYLDWHQSDYSVKCCAKTSAGKPCKMIVDGGSGVNPEAWVALQGSYCHFHQ
jgi:hypothetical protein